MTQTAWVQFVLVLGLLLLAVRPAGGYMQRVFSGETTTLSPLLRPLEAMIYRLAGVRPDQEQGWFDYAVAFLVFHLPSFVLLYVLLRLQNHLPFNPAGQSPLPPDLAFNTAISLVSNTGWQSYSGETTFGHLAQMIGVGVQGFLSGSAGLAVGIALIRGFTRSGGETIGNYWVDVTRAILYVMLPVCVLVGLFMMWQGVPQSFSPSVGAVTLEGAKQSIALGPVASQVAVKLFTDEGSGFFNAQSAHPFENPTVLTNLLGMLLMPLIGAGLTNTFGRMAGNERQGWALLGAMLVLLLAGTLALHAAEAGSNQLLASIGVDQHLGNLEGKEVRFGIPGSALFSEIATATSGGAVNAMHDSYLPLGGLVLLFNMMLDEVVIGVPGSGLFGMLLFAIMSVFIGGLMIGRTPEYVGKKIEAREVKLAMLALLVVPGAVLGLTALAVVLPAAVAVTGNAGPHGFSEILYAYTSVANTNGSGFAGLATNTTFYNLTLAPAMILGRFFVIVPVLALAGSLAGKGLVPASAGTLPTTGALWVGLLVGVVVIVGGLSYFPALALGPIEEQLAMLQRTGF